MTLNGHNALWNGMFQANASFTLIFELKLAH